MQGKRIEPKLLDDLEVGQVIAKQVIYRECVLLEQGTVLSDSSIEQLRNRFIKTVYIYGKTIPTNITIEDDFNSLIDGLTFEEASPSKYEDLSCKVFEMAENGDSSFVAPVLSELAEIPEVLKAEIADHLFKLPDEDLITCAEKILGSDDLEKVRSAAYMLEPILSDDVLETLLDMHEELKSELRSPDRECFLALDPAEQMFESNAKRSFEVETQEDIDTYEELLSSGKINIRNEEIVAIEREETASAKRIYHTTLHEVVNMFEKIRSGDTNQYGSAKKLSEIIVSLAKNDPAKAFNLIKSSTLKNYLPAHCLNVSLLATIVGIRKELPNDRLLVLAMSGLLHDVGMVMLDEPVWSKTGPVNDSEFFVIQKHTVYGIDALVNRGGFPKDVAYVCYNHHERIDGSGYPKGKKGNLIDEFSQIIGLCDVFEAMTSSRCYRGRSSLSRTIFHLRHEKGESFHQDNLNELSDFIEENTSFEYSTDPVEETRKTKVFVVDDHPQITGLLTRIFMKLGYEVWAFNDARESWKSWDKIGPDLMITDLEMPGMDGFALCEMVRNYSVHCWVPVVVFSSNRTRETIEKLRSYSLSDFIVKPSSVDEITSRIESVVTKNAKH